MNTIKIAICDDIKPLCMYFKSFFDQEEEFDFVGMAHNTSDCIELVTKTNPHVLLLDIQMETFDSGISLIPQITEKNPNIKIIMLTIHDDNELIFRAFTQGAADYIIKTLPKEKILETIKNVYNNNYTLRPEIAQKILAECQNMNKKHESVLFALDIVSKLSTSEFEILRDLYNGMTYKEVAKKRFVEEVTIRVQSVNILKKLNFKRMRQLTEFLRTANVFDFLNYDENKG